MSSKKYFEREYNFLQLEGDRFAEKHQGLAGELRITQKQRKDPFVERLFEGFSFLAGRIHERLDDDFPEITGGLLEILFPHFLRSFPSCAILEARPIANLLTKPVLVKRGSEVQTPTGKYQVKYKVAAGPQEKDRTIEKTEPAEFIFRTTQDMIVRPMQLKEVRVEDQPDMTTALILQIHPHRNVTYESLDLRHLTLHFHGPESLKYILLLYMTKYVSEVSVRELGNGAAAYRKMDRFRLGIPGLADNEEDSAEECALVPYARQIFSGYRLLQEYFAFRERFFFVDLEGLEAYHASSEGRPFEVKIAFSRKLSSEYRPSARNILLHCAPIVNLFDRPTEELVIDQRLPEYYILPDGDRRKSREVYSVQRVRGVSDSKIQLYKYLPVTSYDILDPCDPEHEFKRFFSLRFKPMIADMADAYIRLFGPSMEEELFPKEILSVEEATLSNGFLPAKYLEAGAINQPVDFPGGIEVANLSAPSEVLPCPDRQNFLWTLITHLTVSYASLSDGDVLKGILSLYNWSQEQNNPNRKKIQGIAKIHPPRPTSIFRNQAVIRGIEFRLDIDPANFENGEGDIELFGSVLSRFLSQYVTINSFVILTMNETGTGRQTTWPPDIGKILPI
jgi:type VI secretion system protein ImpG